MAVGTPPENSLAINSRLTSELSGRVYSTARSNREEVLTDIIGALVTQHLAARQRPNGLSHDVRNCEAQGIVRSRQVRTSKTDSGASPLCIAQTEFHFLSRMES